MMTSRSVNVWPAIDCRQSPSRSSLLKNGTTTLIRGTFIWLPPCYSARQFGARFSANAIAPSIASAEVNTGLMISPCRANASPLSQSAACAINPGGQFSCSRKRLAGRHQLIDQTGFLHPAGRETPAGQGNLHGQVIRNPARQPEQSAGPGDQPAPDFGQAEYRGLAGDDEVAGQSKLESAGQGISLDRRDDRLPRRLLDDAAEAAA